MTPLQESGSIRIAFVGPGCWMWFLGERDGVAATREQAIERANEAALEAIRDDFRAMPPREQARLLDINGPYDADACPVCFDQDSTGCLVCGGSGRRPA